VSRESDLAALDREFNTGGKMHLALWKERRAEILARPPDPAPAPAPAADQFITRDTFMNVLKILGAATKKALGDRTAELEARVKILEERLPLSYGGTYTEGAQSNKGVFYTDHGSLWYCKETTRDRPGASAAFVLAAKRGTDAPEPKYSVN
jgi:hypothetical protein